MFGTRLILWLTAGVLALAPGCSKPAQQPAASPDKPTEKPIAEAPPKHTLPGFDFPESLLAVNSDGTLVAASRNVSPGDLTKVFDLSGKEVVRWDMGGHSLAFNLDGKTLAQAAAQGVVNLRDPLTGKIDAQFGSDVKCITDRMIFMADGRMLICLQTIPGRPGDDGPDATRIIALDTSLRRTYELASSTVDRYRDIALDPGDKEAILAATDDQIIRIRYADAKANTTPVGRFALPINWKLGKQAARDGLQFDAERLTVAWLEGGKLKWSRVDGGEVKEMPRTDPALGNVTFHKVIGFASGGLLAMLVHTKGVHSLEFYDLPAGARAPKPLYALRDRGNAIIGGKGKLIVASEKDAIKVWEVPAKP